MGLSFPSYFSPIPMRRFHSKIHACIKVGQTHIKVKGLAKESTFLLMLKEKAMDYYTMYRDDHTHEHDHGKDISIIYGCNHGTLLPKNKNHGKTKIMGSIVNWEWIAKPGKSDDKFFTIHMARPMK